MIHGCRKNTDGSMRVIDTAKTSTCPNGYTTLDWNQTGPQGPAGAAGPPGPAGPAGSPGVSGYEIVEVRQDLAANAYFIGQNLTQTAYCPPGKVALGGDGEAGRSFVRASQPLVNNVNGTGWQQVVQVSPDASTNLSFAFITYAICATAN